jgi:hypothetical protein
LLITKLFLRRAKKNPPVFLQGGSLNYSLIVKQSFLWQSLSLCDRT